MQDEPHPPEILAAVAAFLRNEVMPAADGPLAYKARVAAAALDLVRREIEPDRDGDAELTRLRALLVLDGDLAFLNAELARRLGSGAWDFATPGVAAHLWATTREKLAVDQPRYWGLKAAPEDTKL